MLHRLLVIRACVAVVSLGSGSAWASDCESIRDSDARNHCRAVSKGEKSACESIRDSDKRNFCRAVAGGGRSACESIKDSDLRNRCRAQAR